MVESSEKPVTFQRHPHLHGNTKVGSTVEWPIPSQVCWESGLGIIESVSWNTENLKQKLVDTYLQKATRIIFLNHLQAVLHETRGLAQFHCAMRDLISNHLGLMRQQNGPKWQRVEKKANEDFGKLLQTMIQEHHGMELNLSEYFVAMSAGNNGSGRRIG